MSYTAKKMAVIWEKWQQETDLKNITEEKSIGPNGWFNSGGDSGDSGQLEKLKKSQKNPHWWNHSTRQKGDLKNLVWT